MNEQEKKSDGLKWKENQQVNVWRWRKQDRQTTGRCVNVFYSVGGCSRHRLFTSCFRSHRQRASETTPPPGELSPSYLQMFQRVQTSESLLGNRSNAVSLEHSGVGEEVQSHCSKFWKCHLRTRTHKKDYPHLRTKLFSSMKDHNLKYWIPDLMFSNMI